jgi:WD40 repeat protein
MLQPGPVLMRRLAQGIWQRRRFTAGLRTAVLTVGILLTLAGDNLLPPPEHYSTFITAIGFSPDGKTIATSGNSGIRLWDVATGRRRHFPSLRPASEPLSGPAIFSADGRTLFTPSSYIGSPGAVQSWDIATSQVTRTFQTASEDYVASGLALSRDDKTLAASVRRDDRHVDIWLWDVATGEHITTLTGHTDGITAMAFDPSGKSLASADNETLRLWNLTSHTQIDQPQHRRGSITDAVVFSPDGKTLASCDPDKIQLWNAATGKAVGPPFAKSWDCWSLAYSPGGKALITYGLDETDDRPKVRTLDAATGHVIKAAPISQRIVPSAVSPDGKTLAAGAFSYGFSPDPGTVWLWDITTGHTIKILTGSGEDRAS